MKNITNEIAEKVLAHFESDEVKSLVEATEKATDSDTGTFEVVITTENLDRYQEVIAMNGWELEHYRSNPVVLWGHDHNNLIGVCTSLEIVDAKLVAKGKFAPTEEGQEKRKLYDAGFLKATSVGFIEKEREGNLITKAELLEFSFVSVPANPYALSLAMEKGLNINELVTKGIFTVKEAETVEEEVKTVEEKPTDIEKAVIELTGTVNLLVDKVSALDVAGDSKPEGTKEGGEQDEDDEDVKAFAKKQAIQKGVTVLGEVLADIRSIDRR